MKITRKKKELFKLLEKKKIYNLNEAIQLVKKMATYVNFDTSIDIAVRLELDTRLVNNLVRGVVKLPHGTGRHVKVLAIVNPSHEEEAKKFGADYVGLDEYLTKIREGWTDIDVIITVPDIMPQLAKLGKILGPRGLMPNPKNGTITSHVGNAIKEVKSGQIQIKVDRNGIIHTTIGKASFSVEKLIENYIELMQGINRLKPSSAKGTYIKNIFISSTMSPGVKVDIKSI